MKRGLSALLFILLPLAAGVMIAGCDRVDEAGCSVIGVSSCADVECPPATFLAECSDEIGRREARCCSVDGRPEPLRAEADGGA